MTGTSSWSIVPIFQSIGATGVLSTGTMVGAGAGGSVAVAAVATDGVNDKNFCSTGCKCTCPR